jgi:hypothetical protein
VLFAVSHSTQTDLEPRVLTVSFSTQTEDDVPTRMFAVQTESRQTAEMEIQTDAVVILVEGASSSSPEGTSASAAERSRSPSPLDETLASSSSSSSLTIIPSTPKSHPKQLLEDQPPAYGDITTSDQQDRERRIAAEILQEWHQGVKIPFQPVEGGISEEVAREWKALKEELGVECAVIDKIVASSERSAPPNGNGNGKKRRSRFYNIYNTYVYGANKSSSSSTSSGTIGMAGQALMVVGVSALAMLVMSPYVVPHYSVPGGATYYDRTAWHSFNSMQAAGEGFSPDGTAAVWNFLGRVGGGAARIARGWPT